MIGMGIATIIGLDSLFLHKILRLTSISRCCQKGRRLRRVRRSTRLQKSSGSASEKFSSLSVPRTYCMLMNSDLLEHGMDAAIGLGFYQIELHVLLPPNLQRWQGKHCLQYSISRLSRYYDSLDAGILPCRDPHMPGPCGRLLDHRRV